MGNGDNFYIELELMPLASLGSKHPFHFYVHLTNTKFDVGTGPKEFLTRNLQVDPKDGYQQGLFADDSFLAEMYKDDQDLVMAITVWKDLGYGSNNDHKNDRFFLHCGVACEISSMSSKRLPWSNSSKTITNSHITRYNQYSYYLGLAELPMGRTFYIRFSNLSAGENTNRHSPLIRYKRDGKTVGQEFKATFDWGKQ